MGSVIAPPLLLALGAALAAWLVAFGLGRERLRRLRRRDRMRALIRGVGEAPRGRTAEARTRRRRPRLALRRMHGGRVAGALTLLRRAGVEISPREFLLIEGIALTIGALAGSALLGPAGGALGALAGLALPVFWLRHRVGARRAKINSQLDELMQSVAGGLAAGQSFAQALESASREIDEPLRGEVRLMLNEIELGASTEDALVRLGERVQDEDLDLVVDAVLIQRRVGGALGEVLTNIAETIRDRIRIRREVKALTGQARLSAWVLGGLPVAIGGLLFLLSPEYMRVLVEAPLGRMLIVGGVISEGIGVLFLRRIASVQT